MVKRTDYDELAAAGGLAKPTGKRKPEEGREQHNSTLRAFAPIKRVNAERLAARRDEDFGLQAEACRAIGICCCCGRSGRTEPHHLKARAAGGDDSWCIPMLHEHHMAAHNEGAQSFWLRVGVDPEAVRDGMREWVASGCPANHIPVRRR